MKVDSERLRCSPLAAGEVCTLDSSVWFIFTWKFASTSPLYFAVIPVFIGFFEALDDEEFFVIDGSGVAGSPRVLTPR